jgi:hypothetical protein
MQAILDRIIAKINEAPIDREPSDNFFMEDIFPAEIYADILKRLPADDVYDFIDHPDAILPDGTRTRKLLALDTSIIPKFKAEDQAFWQEMHTILVSRQLQQALIQKFAGPILERFGQRVPEMVTVPIFYRDYPGYRISVHTDAPYKIATMQFYFPSDESQIHLGTSFHKRIGNGFELLKTNPFKPNSGYAFARTESSWHSVKEMAKNERKRDTLALTIYQKGYEYKSNDREYK